MATWCYIVCRVRTCFLFCHFWADFMPGCSAVDTGWIILLYAFIFKQHPTQVWHSTRNQMTPLDFGFPHSCYQMSPRFSFDRICCHWVPLLPLRRCLPILNWPVVFASKLGMMGNVVCRSSLSISLPVLMIHNSVLAVTVTWCCQLVLHTSAPISIACHCFDRQGVHTSRTSQCFRGGCWSDCDTAVYVFGTSMEHFLPKA